MVQPGGASTRNDPYDERDFHRFKLAGETFFWKTDYLDRDVVCGLEDPSDPEKTSRQTLRSCPAERRCTVAPLPIAAGAFWSTPAAYRVTGESSLLALFSPFPVCAKVRITYFRVMPMTSQATTLDSIECPNCGHAIPVSEVLSHQIAERARAESNAEIAKLKHSLARKEQEIRERESKVDEAVKSRVAALSIEIEREAREKAKGYVSTEMADLQNQLVEALQQRDVAQKAELEARKRARELDERAKNLDFEVARKIDAEQQRIQQEATRRADEQYQLKLAEKEKQIQDAKRVNDELKRKLEQGSQQAQGEVLELQLEELLRSTFPMDQIEPVPKGFNGADIVQQVMSRSGRLCGTIVWEFKRTKVFSELWLQKLKDDQRKLTAEIAVLVSEALPKDCHTFLYMTDVWVSNPQCAISLAAALRMQLLNVAAAAGAKQKSEILYEYVVASTQFRQRVEAIAEAFVGMQAGLQEEKRTAQRQWAKREKQIEQVISNTAGMYGELQALTGLPDIHALTAGVPDVDSVVETNGIVMELPLQVKKNGEDEALSLEH
jgi:hypothetical protein